MLFVSFKAFPKGESAKLPLGESFFATLLWSGGSISLPARN